MILLVYGNIGSGKTHNTIRHELLPALEKGRKVFTNIDGLDPRKVGQFLRSKMPRQWRYWEHLHLVSDEWLREKCKLHALDGSGLEIPPHSTVIVDEAQMTWNSREFKGTSKAFIDLLAYSRHHDIDFVFITQHPKLLEVVVTRLANQFQHCENLGFLGSLAAKGYRVLYKRAPEDRADYTSTFTYDLQIFALYKSSKVPEELRAGRLSTTVRVILGLILFLIGYSVVNFNRDSLFMRLIFGNPKKAESVQPAVKQPQKTNANGPRFDFSESGDTSLPPAPPAIPEAASNSEKVLQAILAHEAMRDSLSDTNKRTVIHSSRPPDPKGYVMRNTRFYND